MSMTMYQALSEANIVIPLRTLNMIILVLQNNDNIKFPIASLSYWILVILHFVPGPVARSDTRSSGFQEVAGSILRSGNIHHGD